jgi:2,3-diaminopropionate biosynthesis protein SbnB
MRENDILVIRGDEVRSLLAGQELAIIDQVQHAYEIHALGQSSLPHSTFLRFPENERDRIIGLPAYLGGSFGIAGIKWVASFPENVGRGLDRASATVILNSAATGRPEAIIEASTINAKRTAASAALAAKNLISSRQPSGVALIGCGLINFEIARFLLAVFPDLTRFCVFDLSPGRAAQFKEKCLSAFEGIQVDLAPDINSALKAYPLISFATTAVKPHVNDLTMCPKGTVILHISLRDITGELILTLDNIADDIDHACRAQTSLHLAEQISGSREFIRGALADVTMGRAKEKAHADAATVFSPFGLGILDLAVSSFVRARALEAGKGRIVEGFLPQSWIEAC